MKEIKFQDGGSTLGLTEIFIFMHSQKLVATQYQDELFDTMHYEKLTFQAWSLAPPHTRTQGSCDGS